LDKRITQPFQVLYVQAKPGEKQLPAQWAVPFDTEFRAIETPNAPEGAHPAYASIGWHVVQNFSRYYPPYRVLETMNLRKAQSPGVMQAWEEKIRGQLTITNRRNGVVSWLAPSYSIMEAVVSWFVREKDHEGLVLCHDEAEDVWYVEPLRDELIVWMDADGREVVQGEGTATHYHTDKHPNAIMTSGE
jgi:hypothetical protein